MGIFFCVSIVGVSRKNRCQLAVVVWLDLLGDQFVQFLTIGIQGALAPPRVFLWLSKTQCSYTNILLLDCDCHRDKSHSEHCLLFSPSFCHLPGSVSDVGDYVSCAIFWPGDHWLVNVCRCILHGFRFRQSSLHIRTIHVLGLSGLLACLERRLVFFAIPPGFPGKGLCHHSSSSSILGSIHLSGLFSFYLIPLSG